MGQTAGSITGLVTDPTGASVMGANLNTVHLRCTSVGQTIVFCRLPTCTKLAGSKNQAVYSTENRSIQPGYYVLDAGHGRGSRNQSRDLQLSGRNTAMKSVAPASADLFPSRKGCFLAIPDGRLGVSSQHPGSLVQHRLMIRLDAESFAPVHQRLRHPCWRRPGRRAWAGLVVRRVAQRVATPRL
jgi:hypothetical protein